MSADRYSFSLTTFSPSGKLVQIEHALTAVSQGITSIGIKATNGIVIATEKKHSSHLVDPSTVEKISTISNHIGLVYSGMGPDARVLVDKARKSVQEYKKVYLEEPPTMILVTEVASVMQEFTQSGYFFINLVVFVLLVFHFLLLDSMNVVLACIKLIHLVRTFVGKQLQLVKT